MPGSGNVRGRPEMLENLTKSDVVTVLGLGILAAAVSELLPSSKPLLRSAIQFGVDLLTESEMEAEAELIHSLITVTIGRIREDLSNGLVGQPCDGVLGYTPDSATAIVRQIVKTLAK